MKEVDNKEEKKPNKHKNKKSKASFVWGLQIFVLTFFLSLSFSVISQLLIDYTPVYAAIVLLAMIIVINILFDIVGVAAASCEVEPFLAMSSKKIKGARMAVKIAKNAEKFSNICCDVIGDICGIVSGALGASIIVILFAKMQDMFLPSVLFSSMIAAFTVGGKAVGKKIAIKNKQNIIFFVAKMFSVFSKK